jgi:hypothetical protein
MSTIELKRLPGLEGEPRHEGAELGWVIQVDRYGHALSGSIHDSRRAAAQAWNAMIDRIIEECRK